MKKVYRLFWNVSPSELIIRSLTAWQLDWVLGQLPDMAWNTNRISFEDNRFDASVRDGFLTWLNLRHGRIAELTLKF